MTPLRLFILYNTGIFAYMAWRLNEGMPEGRAIKMGLLLAILANLGVVVQWFHTRDRAKGVTPGRSSSRPWGHGLRFALMVLIVWRLSGAADLAFFVIYGFVITVTFWLWDRLA